MAKKQSKKKAASTGIKATLKKKGLRLPHGYEVVVRKKK